MKKYFKIGEISKLYNIGVDSLRYYEEIGILHPERSDGGYRLYSVNDIWRLNVIRDLRELGFGMEQIKQYLNCHSVESTLSLLEDEQIAIQKKMQSLIELQANVELRMKTIRDAQKMPLNKIMLKEYPSRRFYSIPEGYSEEHEMDILIKRLLNMDKNHLYVIGNNQIGTVISLNDSKPNYKSVFVIDENGNDILPAGTYLSVSYKGEYEQSIQWINQLLLYAKEHNFKLIGDTLELLWIDIHTSSNVNEHITELQVLVESE